MDKKLVIIGAGNLASRVALGLHNNGIEICQVYSRTVTSAFTLSRLLGCTYVTQPERIQPEADIYLVSVSDNALDELLAKVNFNNKLVVHTAGSIPMDALKKYSDNYGVFYPLQTFSKYRDIDFSEIPLCIEANTSKNEQILVELASILSKDVRLINSEQRKQIHLAAVFACNFTNHMYAIAEKILQEKDIPFNIILPLIRETASKVDLMSPLSAQTGPAARNDNNIMNEHLDQLKENDNLYKIYNLLSEEIFAWQKKYKN